MTNKPTDSTEHPLPALKDIIESGQDCGVIDMRGSLVVSVDEEDVVSVVEGWFPATSQGDPYIFGVLCLDTEGNAVTVTTDMDHQTLVID